MPGSGEISVPALSIKVPPSVGNRIEDASAEAIGKALATNSTLQTLDLSSM